MNMDANDCEPDSIVGPVDEAKIRRHEPIWSEDGDRHVFDPAYVAYCLKNHGGVPKRQWFKTRLGTVRRLGRFVNFGGPYTPPFREDWESPGNEIREKWSLGNLEGIANIESGCGAFLVALGILYSGPHSPDGMGTSHSDLVCFDYSDIADPIPSVVLWDNSLACHEYYDCEESGRDSFTEMDHSRFTEPIAVNFTEFLRGLRATESEL
jgi:hypothetical protein